MSTQLDDLVKLLALERIEENLFRGQSEDLGWGTLYGGHVLAQALTAATRTAPTDRHAHSLQAYFLRPGSVTTPTVYQVHRLRDGGSFTTRSVVAIQSGEEILHLAVSYQVREPGFDHQAEMPTVPPPDGLRTEQERARAFADKLPPFLAERILGERAFDVRPVDPPLDPFAPDKAPPERAVWMRANGKLGDDEALHRQLLCYASDFSLLTTALKPHAVTWLSTGMRVASLDHVLWFHRPFRMDEWLLHVMDSPSAHHGRGLVHGRIYTREGRLVASTAQEGMIRRKATS